jgi:hypothetical protein
MIEILEFIFRGFWTFAGVALLTYWTLHYVCNMIARWSPWNHPKTGETTKEIAPLSGHESDEPGGERKTDDAD